MSKRSRGDGLTSRTAQDSGGDHMGYRNPTKKALVAAIERMVPVDRDKLEAMSPDGLRDYASPSASTGTFPSSSPRTPSRGRRPPAASSSRPAR